MQALGVIAFVVLMHYLLFNQAPTYRGYEYMERSGELGVVVGFLWGVLNRVHQNKKSLFCGRERKGSE
ncbi:MAG: hypothetical protein KDA57_23160 [Planctomycetales bacterium]|nr:hypothetical protein [Planctomycetales bacterium]